MQNMEFARSAERHDKTEKKVMSGNEVEREEQKIIENSPFLNAKLRHLDVYLAQSQNISQWRLISFVLLLLLAFSVFGNIYLAGSVKIQPYVVQVDERGYAIPINMADSSGIDERVVSAQIGQFIMNSRIRVQDQNAQILFARNAYKSVAGNSRALTELNNYFSANPPTESEQPVNIDISSIIPLTSETYQAEWTETATDSRGVNISTNLQGRYEITISPPKDMVNLVNNPLGVYITDYYVQRKIR